MSEQNFTRWDFIMQWHPNYTHSDEVLRSDILTRFIDGQWENWSRGKDENGKEIWDDELLQLQKDYPTTYDAELALEVVDSQLFLEAYDNFKNNGPQWN